MKNEELLTDKDFLAIVGLAIIGAATVTGVIIMGGKALVDIIKSEVDSRKLDINKKD